MRSLTAHIIQLSLHGRLLAMVVAELSFEVNILAGRRPAALRIADRHRIVFIEVFVHFDFALLK